VRYVNIPSNLRLINKSDSIVNLNIKVQGFDFFSDQYFLRKNQLFDVSLKHVKLIKRDDFLTGYLLTSHIGKDIATQSNYPLEIYSFSPDTLYFTFEKKSPKTITPLKRRSTPETITNQAKDTLRIYKDSVPAKSFRSEIKKTKKNK